MEHNSSLPFKNRWNGGVIIPFLDRIPKYGGRNVEGLAKPIPFDGRDDISHMNIVPLTRICQMQSANGLFRYRLTSLPLPFANGKEGSLNGHALALFQTGGHIHLCLSPSLHRRRRLFPIPPNTCTTSLIDRDARDDANSNRY